MSDLSSFEITERWPAKNPNAIQLYTAGTPNGYKVSAMLEETGLAYEVHRVKFDDDDQHTPEFESLNPNGKIPAIIDPDGPGGKPIGLFESGAILQYLAEKTGKLLSADPVKRIKTLQWLNFQMGGVGPMFGQFGHFHRLTPGTCDHPYPITRYKNETQRLLDVLDEHFEDNEWLAGDEFSIADVATWPWVRALETSYQATELLELDDYENVNAWLARCLERPASKKAINIPPPG